MLLTSSMLRSTWAHTWYHVYGYALLRSTCLYACSMLLYLCLCLHMLVCSNLWSFMLLCLHPHAYMLVSLLLCSLHVLCYFPCACVLYAMFVCLDLGYVCHAMCYCSPFVPFVTSSCVLAYRFGPDLDPMVFVIVHTPWPISKGLDHPYLHVYACLFLCFMFVLASLILGFVMLDALRRLDLVWLHPTPMRPCSDVTI